MNVEKRLIGECLHGRNTSNIRHTKACSELAMLGNKELMKREKASFLSSRQITPEAVMASHAWAKNVRASENSAMRRNRYVLENSGDHFFGSVASGGNLAKLLLEMNIDWSTDTKGKK